VGFFTLEVDFYLLRQGDCGKNGFALDNVMIYYV